MSNPINRLRKRERYIRNRDARVKAKGKVPSSTPGISKGDNCRKIPLMVRYAKDSRFYRTDPRNYASACKIALVRNKLTPLMPS